MTSIKNIRPIEKSKRDIKRTVLTNIVKMLGERGYISDINQTIKDVINSEPNDLVYRVIIIGDKNPAVIKILQQKITAVNKTSGISDFLNDFKDNRKIIIVNSINKKAKQFINANYPKAEIFTEEEKMINLVDNILVPKHELLTKEEVETFYDNFNCTKRSMPKLLSGDPVARYYGMKPGDIVRIIRPSRSSGYITSYRLVVKGDPK